MLELLPDNGYLWLDDHIYTTELLANGEPPLLGIADYVAFRRQAAALLASDIMQIALDTLCAAWLDEHPELVEKMGAKKRAVAPLRAMLGDDSLRTHLTATVAAIRQAFPNQPLVITLPSPRAWIAVVRARAGVEAISIGQAEADSASVYVAEFLRAFGDCEVDGILLVEDAADEPSQAEELAWYQPIFNVASHFRWKTGILLPEQKLSGDLPSDIDFLVARSLLGTVPTFLMQPPSVWLEDSAQAATLGRYMYAQIPSDAQPERVLGVINELCEGRSA